MSIVTLPTSMNLGEVKPSCVADCKSSIQRFRSDNSTYRENDIVRIEIPCGRAGTYLHPQDSFLEFKMTPVFAGNTGGSLSLDGTAFSIFKSIRILHGSNVLANIQNCNRLYNALYDLQCSSSKRNGGQITHGINTEDYSSLHNNLFGQVVVTGGVYQFALTLPCSILGSLQEKALPIGWCSASSLYLELEIDSMNKIFTNRTHADTVSGTTSAATAAPIFTSLTLSDIYYNAKVSLLGLEYDNLLRNSLGDNIVIPSTEYRGELKSINAGAFAFSDKFSFNCSSAKMFLWWMTSQSTANGVLDTYKLNNSITQRQAGACKEFWLSFNGEYYPSQPISMSKSGATYLANKQYGAVAYSHLLRCFNLNSDTEAGGVLDVGIYCENDTSVTTDGTNTKRFIAGIDLDRVDGNNSRSMAGLNTMNMNVVLNVTWETALSTAQSLYAFVCYDTAYVLQDGLLSVRM